MHQRVAERLRIRWNLRRINHVPTGCRYVPRSDQLQAHERILLETLAFEEGEAYDSYLLLEEGRQYFFSSGGRGVVGFETWGRQAYVVGGLLASSPEKPQLLREFLEFTQANGISPKFFNILDVDRELFREYGLRVSKTGEEPLIDLRTTTWRGKQYEWVRRQTNYCQRQGVTFRELCLESLPDADRQATIDALLRVSQEHVESTAFGRELSLTVAKVDFERMHRRRLFIGEQNGGIVAVVVANPAYAGQMWTVETYRKGANAPRGAIPYLIMMIAKQLQSEGVPFLSLCQVPSLRAAESPLMESRLVRFGMHTWWNYINWMYDPPRQYHFKSRFRPVYRECFVAAPPGVQLVPYFMFALKWGVIWPDLQQLPRTMIGRMRKWFHKETLANPDEEDYQVIDNLGSLIDEHLRDRDTAQLVPDEDKTATALPRTDQRIPVVAESKPTVSTISSDRISVAS